MILAIEPITAEKSDEYIQKKWNDRNLYTRLWDLWAQREYTILVTEWKPEILAWCLRFGPCWPGG
jgi:methionine aminopeptidase